MGEEVLLKVVPFKNIVRFRGKRKLALRFIDPFKILERIHKVAYCLMLAVSMDHIHNVFHVLLLYKYIKDSSHILSIKEIDLLKDLSYEELPI